jgi:hypothetical protein
MARISASTPRSAKSWTRDNRTADEVSDQIKARITIPILAQQLFPGWKPDRSCLSPFRQEEKESFSVFANGSRWNDFASDEGGDVFDFFRKAKGCDQRTAFVELKAMLNGGTVSPTPATSPERPKEERKQFHPSLLKPADADLTAIYYLRSIWTPALQIAVDRGLLWVSTLKCFNLAKETTEHHRAFVVTDRMRRAYNARRLDGKVWDHLPSKPKAWLLYGSNGNWPIGIQEAEEFPAIALCEGGPDFLAAFGHALASSVQHLVAPVCMSSASGHIPTDALPYFEGKRVRIFVHDDRAGYDAGGRWAAELDGIASEVDGFSFIGLTDVEGSSIGDLNQLLKVDYDCWEANRETIEGVMSFALEGEKQ